MRALSIVTLLAGLAGCATGHAVTGPDGQPAMEVRCHHHEQWRCANKADLVCGSGRYQVLYNGIRPRTVVRPNGAVATMQPVFHGYMVIRCQ